MSCGIDGALTDRHDCLVLTVADMISAAGFQVAVEPRAFNGRHPESGPDLDVMDFYGYPNSVCMDVTIVNPLAASYVERSSREGLITAHHAEVAKVRKYEESLKLSGRLIAGLAMECTGALGPSLQHVMQTCEDRHNIREGGAAPFGRYGDSWTATAFSDYWSQRLAVQLRRGNADIVLRLRAAAVRASWML